MPLMTPAPLSDPRPSAASTVDQRPAYRGLDLRHHFRGEVLLLLLDALADLEAQEALHGAVPRFEQLADARVGSFTKGWPSRRDLARDTCCSRPSTIFSTMSAGLPSCAAWAAKISRSLRDDARRARRRARDAAGRIAAATCMAMSARQRGVAALEVDQHADAAAVDVARRRSRRARERPKRRTWMFSPILAMSARRVSSTVSPPASGEPAAPRGRRRAGRERGLRDLRRRSAGSRPRVATKSVSQLISTSTAVRPSAASRCDDAFGGDAAGLLVGLGQARLRRHSTAAVDVAVGLDERLLALHHAGAGALAQFLDQVGGDSSSAFLGSARACGRRARRRATAFGWRRSSAATSSTADFVVRDVDHDFRRARPAAWSRREDVPPTAARGPAPCAARRGLRGARAAVLLAAGLPRRARRTRPRPPARPAPRPCLRARRRRCPRRTAARRGWRRRCPGSRSRPRPGSSWCRPPRPPGCRASWLP